MMEPNDDMLAAGAGFEMQGSAVNPVAAPQAAINPDDLHDLFAGKPSQSGADEEDPLAQLRNDPNYAALIRELEYIAAQARLLFAPAEETPSDDLWKKIESKMGSEPEAE